MKKTWKKRGKYMERTWEVHKKYMKNTWKEHATYMEITWKGLGIWKSIKKQRETKELLEIGRKNA